MKIAISCILLAAALQCRAAEFSDLQQFNAGAAKQDVAPYAFSDGLVLPMPAVYSGPSMLQRVRELRALLARTAGQIPDPLGADRAALTLLLSAEAPEAEAVGKFYRKYASEAARPPAPSAPVRVDGKARTFESDAVASREKAEADLLSYVNNMKAAGVEIVSSFVDSLEDGESTLYRFIIAYKGGELRKYVFDGFPAKEKADEARDQALAGFKKAGFPVLKYGIKGAPGAFSFYAVYLTGENEPRREMSYMSIEPEANPAVNLAAAATAGTLEANGMPVLYSLTSDTKTRFMLRFIGKGEVKRVQSGGYNSYQAVLKGAQDKLLELSKIPGSLPLDCEIRTQGMFYIIDYLQP